MVDCSLSSMGEEAFLSSLTASVVTRRLGTEKAGVESDSTVNRRWVGRILLCTEVNARNESRKESCGDDVFG